LPLEIWDNPPSDVLRWITHVTMAAALAITLSTAVAYVRDARKLRRDSKRLAQA
jgi:CDP-diacylglycerol---glycerol-3-phosphate 3-phosphatidyltransferase